MRKILFAAFGALLFCGNFLAGCSDTGDSNISITENAKSKTISAAAAIVDQDMEPAETADKNKKKYAEMNIKKINQRDWL